jgi:hypothetical protein
MNADMLVTIEDEALESVAGGGIGTAIGGAVDRLLSGALGLIGGVLTGLGSALTGLGSFLKG